MSMRLWVASFKVVLRQVRVLISQSKILQREYRKRELAIPFITNGHLLICD